MAELNLDKIGSLIGMSLFELTLNFRMAQEQVNELTKENQALKQTIAELKEEGETP